MLEEVQVAPAPLGGVVDRRALTGFRAREAGAGREVDPEFELALGLLELDADRCQGSASPIALVNSSRLGSMSVLLGAVARI